MGDVTFEGTEWVAHCVLTFFFFLSHVSECHTANHQGRNDISGIPNADCPSYPKWAHASFTWQLNVSSVIRLIDWQRLTLSMLLICHIFWHIDCGENSNNIDHHNSTNNIITSYLYLQLTTATTVDYLLNSNKSGSYYPLTNIERNNCRNVLFVRFFCLTHRQICAHLFCLLSKVCF